MSTSCSEFTEMTQGKPVTIGRVRLADDRIAVEDSSKSWPLASLSADDQASAMEVVRCQGINAMRYNTLLVH
jgi:hypothetical protein